MENLRPVIGEFRDSLYAELSLDRSKQSGGGLQLEYASAGFSSYGARSRVLRLWSAPWPGIPDRQNGRRARRIWHDLVRTDGHYYTLHIAAISIRTDDRPAIARQH